MAAILDFTPTNYDSFAAQSTSTNHALPGGAGPTLLVTNLGPSPAALLLTTDNAATVAQNTGVVVLAGQSLALGVGSNTRIAAVAVGFGSAILNLAQGA